MQEVYGQVQEVLQIEVIKHAQLERERRRWEVAKALFVRLLTDDIVTHGDDGVDSATYHDTACQAVIAADEFLQRFYEPEPDVVINKGTYRRRKT